MAVAPDGASQVAGRKLARLGPWSGTGAEAPLLWGQCRGSAKDPYRVMIDTSRPAYECTCPSRKFPCKHALALLFLWAEGALEDRGARPEYADRWLHREREREREGAGVPAAQAPEQQSPEQQAAARARAERRDALVLDGMAELDRWLCDQLDAGLARAATDGPAYFEQIAARMIDAQAPGVANWLRSMTGITVTGADWPARLLGEFARMRMLARAYQHLERWDEPMRATVRAHIGFTVAKDAVLQTEPVRDTWLAVGLHDVDEERIVARRIWLHGRHTGVAALVLLFAPHGQSFESNLVPGMVIDADLHFYPGRPRLRALPGQRFEEWMYAGGWSILGRTVAEQCAQRAEALTRDPWLGLWPGVLRGSLARHADRWCVRDDEGALIAVRAPETTVWRLLAATGGASVTMFAEMSDTGINPLSITDREVTGGGLVVL